MKMRDYLWLLLAAALSVGNPVFAADTKVSALPSASAVTGDDVFLCVDDPAGTPVSKKCSGTTIGTYVLGSNSVISGLSAGTALPIANGGTGQTTAAAARNALLPTQTGNSGKYLSTDGTNVSWTTVSSGGSSGGSSVGSGIQKGDGAGGFAAAVANTDYQSADGMLTALSALTTTSGKLLYFTGSDAPAQDDFTDSGVQTLTATITTDGTPPSGSTNHEYWWRRIGKYVTGQIVVDFATSGATITELKVARPSDMPAPYASAGQNAANETVAAFDCVLFTTSTGSGASSRGGIRKNSGNTDVDFVCNGSSASYRVAIMNFTYRAQ